MRYITLSKKDTSSTYITFKFFKKTLFICIGTCVYIYIYINYIYNRKCIRIKEFLEKFKSLKKIIIIYFNNNYKT